VTFEAHAEESGIALIDEGAPPPRPPAAADEDDEDYGERPVRRRVRRSEVASSLTMAPGIALLSVGILALVGLLLGFVLVAMMPGGPGIFGPGFRRPGPFGLRIALLPPGLPIIGQALDAVFELLWDGLVIAGGISLIKRQVYPLAMTGAIVGMVPCTNCCCLFSLPIGIWALVVLSKPEVKDAFV
jgi:hypothetical protein